MENLFRLKSRRITKIELGVSDRPTDRRTDKPAYRDARTHLKRICRPEMIGRVIVPEWDPPRSRLLFLTNRAQTHPQRRAERVRARAPSTCIHLDGGARSTCVCAMEVRARESARAFARAMGIFMGRHSVKLACFNVRAEWVSL